jgi:hypothetical protein
MDLLMKDITAPMTAPTTAIIVEMITCNALTASPPA